MEKLVIRRFEEKDVIKVFEMIANTLRNVNIKDYSKKYIEKDVTALSPEHLIERASWMHLYVVCEGNDILGCGGIGPYWGSETESSLFTIFASRYHQSKGIGRKILETLEKDEYFLRVNVLKYLHQLQL